MHQTVTSSGASTGSTPTTALGAQDQSAPPLPVPVARRLRQPSWGDARLLIGVALILVSIVGGALVVSAADRTSPVYMATRPLVPGQLLSSRDLAVVGARLTAGQDRYLSAAGSLAGRYVIAPVRAGELVPVAALGRGDQVGVRPVTVPVDPDSSASLSTGTVVDVWVAEPVEGAAGSGFQEPVRIAAQVVVGAPATRRGALGSSTTTAVQVLVDDLVVPQLIGAVDNGARITLVPVPSGASGTR